MKKIYQTLKNKERVKEKEIILRRTAINILYNVIIRKEIEDYEKEKFDSKKEKYNKIKESEYDIDINIDEKLIEIKKELHKEIERRIRYFEEKEELTIKETQDLERLKDPKWMEKEELEIEEYLINDVYEELFEE